MRILVCSRLSIPDKDRTLPAWEYLRSLGHTVWVEHPDNLLDATKTQGFDPHAIISMGVTIMEETFLAVNRWPTVPLYCYNWDCYEWVWSNPRPGEYNYSRYGTLLQRAREVWVPSVCTGRRTAQWWGVDNWRVILSACPYWNYEDIQDKGYALCTLRHIPDPWDTVFEECCAEIGIPFIRSDHNLSREDYERTVAHCHFLVSHYYEASTGGLTLLEGLYLGKPSLLSDSEWHGGRDYLGDYATYFRYGDKEDFKNKLQQMYEEPPIILRSNAKKWVESQFSDLRMVKEMLERIEATRR